MDTKARDELVTRYYRWARMFTRHPRAEVLPDIDGIVNEALLEAASRYDSTKSSFRTYARTIISGRIKDAFRDRDVYSRDERAKHKRTKEPLPKRRQTGEIRLLRRGTPALQDDLLAADQFLDRVGKLPERLRYVVEQTARGKYLHEIGKALGVSESRASQLLREAEGLLRG